MLKELKAARPLGGRIIYKNTGKEVAWWHIAEKLEIGQVVRVLPGERIPLDGVLVSGKTCVTSGVLTSQNQLVEKVAGDRLFCGVVNCGEAIDVRITSTYNNTTLKHLIDKAEENDRLHMGFFRYVLSLGTMLR